MITHSFGVGGRTIAAVICGSVMLMGADGTPTRDQVLDHLARMRETQKRMLNVQPNEGEFLSNLVRKVNAKRALEIGTSNGYSGIWLCLGLRETGGRLITVEVDRTRWELAQGNFKTAGMADLVDSRLADALEEVPKIEGPLDFVFIDAWKDDYLKYLKMVLPKVRRGGVIVAHNVVNQAKEMGDFLEEIKTNPALKTDFVNVTASGFSVSTKQ